MSDTAPATPNDAAQAAAAAPVIETVDAPTAPAWDGNIASLDPAAQKIIADLRKEAGDNRVAKNAETERVNAILKAAGIKTDEPDPVEVASRSAAEAAAAKRELAIFKAASAAGADPTKLLDSNSFMSSVSGLDPSDGAAVSAAIQAALAANSSLKTARAASASGIPLGGSGEQGQVTEAQLAQMTPDQIVDAQSKGLLRDLLT